LVYQFYCFYDFSLPPEVGDPPLGDFWVFPWEWSEKRDIVGVPHVLGLSLFTVTSTIENFKGCSCSSRRTLRLIEFLIYHLQRARTPHEKLLLNVKGSLLQLHSHSLHFGLEEGRIPDQADSLILQSKPFG
jgi:hypothetical protein